MLPFEPEPFVTLQGRLLAALEDIYPVEQMDVDPASAPSAHRRHVFDWHDGLRMIISRDRQTTGEVVIHLSASLDPDSPWYQDVQVAGRQDTAARMVKRFVQEVEARWRRLGGPPVRFAGLSAGKGVPHWFQEGQRDG